MIVQLKDGAVICGNPYTNKILMAAQVVYGGHGWDVTITSGRDSHETGYHPKDRALDLRVSMIAESQRPVVASELRTVLPPYYDVVYEPEVSKMVDGTLVVIKGAHFHVEADEKKELANKPNP